MANSKTIAWRQISVEAFAIVVSILLAFSIDAWWDGRKGRLQEEEILLGLEIEFVDLMERLDNWAQYNRTGMDYIERYLSDSVSDMNLEAIESTFVHASIANVLDQGGAIDGLIASGRLEKISDREIRARLIKWPDWLEDMHTNDLSARSYAMREITPFLSKHGFPRTACPEEDFIICSGPETAPALYVRLAEDLEFRALLINRRVWMRAIARDHENAREEASEILVLIKARLEVLDN
jgi:hypothetical protein